MHYDGCINVDNGGLPWCYTNFTNKEWDICNSPNSPDSLDKNPSDLPAAFGLPAALKNINSLFENHPFPGNLLYMSTYKIFDMGLFIKYSP